ncbi:ABC transporter substrate-binding protein [Microbacterium hydrocarbonoxydans]|uniref:ABC transporter substrate-binding protein n=1 Tax=Microbacterium hydrocarbonoxydans TaxID=273678 RepID=UPI0007BBD3EA|nr:iron-siderophore ABC transporter substrate-binding protein [Microbacterium hydrocarbonoxydans]GAT71927.1 ferric enterobactin transport system [Microbacterium sp. HM58-2]
MSPFRSALALLAAGALVLGLAGCQASAAPETETETEATAAADAGFPLTIEHAMGETTIPERPLRVVALDPSYVDATLLLGAELVGYAEYRQDPENPFAPYLGDVTEETKDAVNVGTIAEPDLEKILELEPDLIISAKVRQEALYPQLAKIAPTVFSESTGPTWKENVVLLGTALGEQEKAEALVAEYEERAAAVGAEILEADPEATYSLVRFAGEDTARLYSSTSFIGEIMSDMGLPRPEGQPDTDETIFVPLSAEQILQADASVILVSAWEPEGAEGDASRAQRAQFESNPLWSKLTGEIVPVDDATFVASVSIQGAHAVITELAEHFGVDPLD